MAIPYLKNYIILLTDFSLEDDNKYTNKIFKILKDSGITIVGSNGGSDNWHFTIALKQIDEQDHSNEVKDLMSLVLQKFGLQIKNAWAEEQ